MRADRLAVKMLQADREGFAWVPMQMHCMLLHVHMHYPVKPIPRRVLVTDGRALYAVVDVFCFLEGRLMENAASAAVAAAAASTARFLAWRGRLTPPSSVHFPAPLRALNARQCPPPPANKLTVCAIFRAGETDRGENGRLRSCTKCAVISNRKSSRKGSPC